MEEKIKIATSDGKNIYGRLRGEIKSPFVVFVHGLGGLMDQQIYYNGSRFFEKEGISSLRFNLYGWEPDARNLSQCTLKSHSEDFDRVVSYLRKRGVKKIIAIGHSFGAPTILLSAKKDFDILILWDPSYAYPLSFENAEYVKELDAYKGRWNFDIIISKKMIQESKKLKEKEEKIIKELKVPIKIINAEKSRLASKGKRYFELANEPKERVVIRGANHTFDEDGVAQKLFTETLSWIKRFV